MAVECIKASPSEDDKVHRLTERIFNHFFPANSTNCSSDDCRWFFAYANSQIQWLTKGTEAGIGGQVDLEAAQNGCHTNDQMSIHILKLYLSRILGEQSGGTSSSQPLAFYNDKVSLYIGLKVYVAVKMETDVAFFFGNVEERGIIGFIGTLSVDSDVKLCYHKL